MILTSLLFSLTASADVRFEGFALKADNSFEVQYSAPMPQVARGVLSNAQRLEVVGAQVTTTVQWLASTFVVLSFTEKGQSSSELIILEQLERLKYSRIHHQRIQGEATSLLADFDNSLRDLHKLNNWDATLALRAMVSYFDANPGRKMRDFYNAVELGHVKAVARPAPKGSLPVRQVPRKDWGREREAPVATEERRERTPEFRWPEETTPPTKTRRREREIPPVAPVPPPPPPAPARPPREPQPWEPRRVPDWARNRYPGQSLKSPGQSPFSGYQPKKRSKSLFELMFSN